VGLSQVRSKLDTARPKQVNQTNSKNTKRDKKNDKVWLLDDVWEVAVQSVVIDDSRKELQSRQMNDPITLFSFSKQRSVW